MMFLIHCAQQLAKSEKYEYEFVKYYNDFQIYLRFYYVTIEIYKWNIRVLEIYVPKMKMIRVECSYTICKTMCDYFKLSTVSNNLWNILESKLI